MAIAGLVFAFLIAPVGIILSIIALVQLKKSGGSKGMAIAGLILGIVFTIAWIIIIITIVALTAGVVGNLLEMCSDLGPGVWEVNGVTYECE